MSASKFKEEIRGIGTVYMRTKPTKIDKVGCDGLFISRVVISEAFKRQIYLKSLIVIEAAKRDSAQ